MASVVKGFELLMLVLLSIAMGVKVCWSIGISVEEAQRLLLERLFVSCVVGCPLRVAAGGRCPSTMARWVN